MTRLTIAATAVLLVLGVLSGLSMWNEKRMAEDRREAVEQVIRCWGDTIGTPECRELSRRG